MVELSKRIESGISLGRTALRRLLPLTRQEANAIAELAAILGGKAGATRDVIERVEGLKDKLNGTLHPGAPEPDSAAWAKLERVANHAFAAYTTIPWIRRDDEGFPYIGHKVFSPEGFDLSWQEQKAIENVIYLASRDILHQMVSCGACGMLFLPIRKGQKNCDAACSRKEYETRPDYRVKKNARDRANRAAQKMLDEGRS